MIIFPSYSTLSSNNRKSVVLTATHASQRSDVLPMFQANWYRAAQYCRYHGMHLASINSQEENDKLEKHIRDFGTD
jgi:hypothetical protein